MSLVLIAYVIIQRLDDGLPAVLLLVQNYRSFLESSFLSLEKKGVPMNMKFISQAGCSLPSVLKVRLIYSHFMHMRSIYYFHV